MRPSFKDARSVVARKATHWIAVAVVFLLAVLAATPSRAAVEYVRVCDAFGVGFYYIPGTETCQNANQIVANQFAVARAQTRASTGTAMAAALVNPFLPDGTNFAISAHWATFNGQHAVGIAGLMRIHGNLSLTIGVSVGLDRGSLISVSERRLTEFGVSIPSESWSDLRTMARLGLTYSW
jgi:uncharacterized membrane protein YeiH